MEARRHPQWNCTWLFPADRSYCWSSRCGRLHADGPQQIQVADDGAAAAAPPAGAAGWSSRCGRLHADRPQQIQVADDGAAGRFYAGRARGPLRPTVSTAATFSNVSGRYDSVEAHESLERQSRSHERRPQHGQWLTEDEKHEAGLIDSSETRFQLISAILDSALEDLTLRIFRRVSIPNTFNSKGHLS